MEKSEILQHIADVGLVPVIRAEGKEEAIRVIDAIEAGGIPLLEITMTVPGAISIIEAVRQREKSAVVGAGTVLDAETARACILAGAQFVVSPALNVATIEICRRYSVPVMCGALTPTEVVAAWSAGADVVKIFPCGAVGGASYIKALKAPFPQIALMPTGGVSLKTAADFIKAGSFALGVGSDLLDHKAIEEEDWNTLATAVSARAREYVKVVSDARAALAG
ncbi:MAG: bifunctional 4-hydroxy-2-oxoglutarate aldolase/2-dehydro-3-deoxy-phosphogluconate aldolase [Vicinamibacteria bacterium]|nr:bifunctional 4-hydroxy-2-oxoglutarate aldolase/2-dehydro-3-deoxy-phosphogluconate aldolase [Vicinamibacteria bacterium]